MENIELYKKEINGGEITNIQILDEELVVEYEEGKLSIKYYHGQDCCENVYADFSVLKYHLEDIKGKNFGDLVIKGVIDMGFLLCLADQKVFIPCYNSQNGYYSSDLELQIITGEVATRIDISKFVEDQY